MPISDVTALKADSNPYIAGAVTLASGSGITLLQSGQTITVTSTGGGGSVTSVSVLSANGFAGTVATPTSTPAITLTTTITGILKGNGTSITAATAGVDYINQAAGTNTMVQFAGPSSVFTATANFTYDSTASVFAVGFGGVTNLKLDQTNKLYVIGNPTDTRVSIDDTAKQITLNASSGTKVSNLTTNGLVKTTGGTGLLATAVAGTDYQAPITLTTTGTSGVSTFISNVLNVPNYSGGFPTGANPTAQVVLTAVNGTATTFLRSDGAPALSQAIVPIWTGTHTFTNVYNRFGTVAAYLPVSKGVDFVYNDNTTSGVQIGVENQNGGSSAYNGFYLNNNLASDMLVDHFGFLGQNSSTYSDTTFGTLFAVPNLVYLQNTDAAIAYITSSTTIGGHVFYDGGTATTSEVARINKTGLTIGLAGTLAGTLKIASAGGGTTNLVTSSAAGSGTVLLPSVPTTDTVALLGTAQTFTKANRNAFVQLTDAPTIPFDGSLSNAYYVTLGGNRTLGIPTNLATGRTNQTFALNVYQGVGGFTLSYSWVYQFANETAPVLQTGKGQLDGLVGTVNNNSTSTVTISNATPAVVTWTAHGLQYGERVQFTTTGTLPSGLNTGTTYWVNVTGVTQFNVATSLANLQAGIYVATTTPGSGVHTALCLNITINMPNPMQA